VAEALSRRDFAALTEVWAAELPVAGAVLRRVDGFERLLVNDVVRVDCARWSDGRLVLLGDAAHAMAPNLGQGANSAIVDAAVLALELVRAGPLDDVLARYTARRRPAVRRVQNGADRAAAVAGIRNPALRFARDTALRLAGLLPGAATRLTRSSQQEDPAPLYRALTGLRDKA
jgi:2-polyprenyl-6-methoxyphenol hydroxylase-like FAD-dependent oxidoreductase